MTETVIIFDFFGSIKIDGLQNISANCVIKVLLSEWLWLCNATCIIIAPTVFVCIEKQLNGNFLFIIE